MGNIILVHFIGVVLGAALALGGSALLSRGPFQLVAVQPAIGWEPVSKFSTEVKCIKAAEQLSSALADPKSLKLVCFEVDE